MMTNFNWCAVCLVIAFFSVGFGVKLNIDGAAAKKAITACELNIKRTQRCEVVITARIIK